MFRKTFTEYNRSYNKPRGLARGRIAIAAKWGTNER
jgi:hypothetical protein